MVPAIKQSGKDVQLVGNTGVPANLAFVKNGDVQIGDFNFLPNPVEGWQGVDQLSRIILKQPAATVWQNVPAQLITQDNFATASTSPAWTGYQSKFTSIWGLG
jgi:ABC-type sugar transport system substrate-binding protein